MNEEKKVRRHYTTEQKVALLDEADQVVHKETKATLSHVLITPAPRLRQPPHREQ